MPTFETFPRFERDWKNLTSQQQAMFRKIVLEAFVPDLMARTARSSQACTSKGSPNATIQLEPRPSLVHRIPDATRRRACRNLLLPATVRLLQVRVEPERGWLLQRR